MAEEKLAMRSEVPVEETWDLTLLYKTEEDMYKDLEAMKTIASDLVKNYKGKLDNAKAVNDCLDLYREFLKKEGLVGTYVSLSADVDHNTGSLQERLGRVEYEIISMIAELSFIKSEITLCDEKILAEASASTSANKGYLEDIIRDKKYMLSPETEKALAALSNTLRGGYSVYNTAKLADMKFDDFEADGKKYPLGYSLFEDNYEYEKNTAVRRAAFEAFSKKLRQYENVTAEAYNHCVTTEKTMATLRGYESVFDYLLYDQKVTREMYDRQIDIITEKLAPHMRKYAKLLQRIHKLPEMKFSDLKLTVDPDYAPAVSMAEAKKYCMEGLSILGPEYVAMVEEAFDNRWFDYANNQGKCTGGYCSSPYGAGNSYILLSFNQRMSDVFTMAHELGHAGHFRACNNAQSIFDTNVSTYFVESPSTMNELLMVHHLLKTSDDKRFKRFVLANMVSNTYYHNFVTHLLEAAYQREVYKIVDQGGTVTAETLNGLKRGVLEKFWGDAVDICDGAELTWMRQPHYYMGLYSYTYSAGLTIATEACARIEREGAPAVADWKEALKAGSTLTPMEFARKAGVDISTDAALLHTVETIGSYIDEIIRLTDELG